MSFFVLLIISLFIYMNIFFLFSLIKKRNDVADIAWGLGFVLLAWLAFFITDNLSTRGLLVNVLVSIWGIRLSWHIYSRNKRKKEDYRYLEWRKKWGKLFLIRSFLQIYILQGTLLFLISLPILLIHKGSLGSLGALDFLGVLIWLFGFLFESIADKQLKT